MDGRNDGNNMGNGKNYAAGILPVCVSQDGEVWVLLGLQPKGAGKAECMLVAKDAKSRVEGVWCVFWGWQDKGDLDEEDTAAREAEEESSGLLGTREELRKFLLSNPQCRILPCLHAVFCGVLSSDEMSAVEDEFYWLRWHTTGLSMNRREMACVKWFCLKDLEAALQSGSNVLKGMTHSKQKLRKFLYQWLLRAVNVFSNDPLMISLRNGRANSVAVYSHLVQNVIPCGLCGAKLLNSERKFRSGRCNSCYDKEKRTTS